MVSFFWALVIFLQLRGTSCQKKGGEGEREEGRDERMVGVCEGGEFELTWDKRICSLHLGGLILLTFAEP